MRREINKIHFYIKKIHFLAKKSKECTFKEDLHKYKISLKTQSHSGGG